MKDSNKKFKKALYNVLKEKDLLDVRTHEEFNNKLFPRWKIDRDYFYSDIFQEILTSTNDVMKAIFYIQEPGFFFDESKENLNIDQKAIEYNSLLFKRLQKPTQEKVAVILSSGSFCPIHSGHVESVELAKKEVENQGYQVIGSFLSPAHDNYINRKTKDKAIGIHKRIDDIIEFIRGKDDLFLDTWEGLANSTDVNFTDVIVRLSSALSVYFNKTIDVFFVCGGDNANFALTFQNKGHVVVVNRPGYEEKFKKYKNVLDHTLDEESLKRILWVENNTNDSSSTKLRNSIPDEIKEMLRNAYQQGQFDVNRVAQALHSDIKSFNNFEDYFKSLS